MDTDVPPDVRRRAEDGDIVDIMRERLIEDGWTQHELRAAGLSSSTTQMVMGSDRVAWRSVNRLCHLAFSRSELAALRRGDLR